ncbi:inositol monophosphatase [Mycobacterium sp. 852013-51886_SCH5428379]|uniref:inositol monophosphatase family protein n=1 Tax=Mycobacterium sp. 852013-51886_SCH5428379 TaxID=1834111 RepID=UPI000801ED4D|nr:inositol monophosphatase family protein [Mycobacterium sp. 852013-51886_SCH5428379]OBB59751.1 inositol monophosphatase [Mycobacterium sp. 852013-51886_SCH5428379]
MKPREDLRGLAVEAAQRGADVCARRLTTHFTAETKSAAGDVVTAVDREAESAVRDVLTAARPDDAILGEELAPQPGNSGLEWVVDPLDGTTNFTRRIPFFGTSVAVRRVSDGLWLAGAVCAPALSMTWSAVSGGGAQVATDEGVQRLPLGLAPTSARVLGTGLSYDPDHRARQVRELAGLLTGYTDMRRFGAAAIDLCLLAQGSLDGFFEDDLAVHDWAAGALIAAEAGATVSRPGPGRDAMSAHWR